MSSSFCILACFAVLLSGWIWPIRAADPDRVALAELNNLYKKSNAYRTAYSFSSVIRDGFDWFLPPEGLPSPPAGCPSVPKGFTFVPQKTYAEYDMYRPCDWSVSTSLRQLADECSKTPYCQGFTSAGMLKFRVPPGELGTGKPRKGGPQSVCSSGPNHLCRRLQQSSGALDKQNYFQWQSWPATQLGNNRCAGTYINQARNMASVLRMGLFLTDQQKGDLTSKATQIISVLETPVYLHRAHGVLNRNTRRSLQPLRKATQGRKMTLAAPINVVVEQLMPAFGLVQNNSPAPGYNSQVMLEMALPAAYDSTSPGDTGGVNYIAPARDQGDCAACTAFAVTALARTVIAAAKQTGFDGAPALSPQFLYFCAGKNSGTRLCSNGTTLEDALNQLKQGNVLIEQCVPWASPAGLSRPASACQKRCALTPGGRFSWSNLQSVADAKDAIVRFGAVVSTMLVYPGLARAGRCNPGQVYSPPSSIPQELVIEAHAVLVVGWNDEKEWWLAQNSWGSWPGGSSPGLIKIKYGTSGLMTPGYMYSLSWSGPGAKPRILDTSHLIPDPGNKACS